MNDSFEGERHVKNPEFLRRLRILSLVEGCSTLVLFFIAMPIKYGLGNEIGVKIVGPIHGGLFIAYVIFMIQAAMEYNWPFKKSVLAFIASLIPFGPFIFDKRLERESIEGALAEVPVND